DGNVHGNEIQAAEVVLYTLWYLTKSYGVNERLTTMMDEYVFYLLPSVNPDGRAAWFAEAGTPHSSRGNRRPEDSDRDGLVDEDPPDDLDGDGHITSMWREDPNGRWVRSQTDPRVFERVRADEKGSWTPLGSEGIDNDGDGRINEDGLGGDDMNRNWPSDKQPEYVQGGAGPYPLSAPEVEAIARFIYDHDNIAAVQSYHNAGGMILRGPGASYRGDEYPGADRRVYDEIATIGEDILPYYRSMIIAEDLYTVHGGFATWTAEQLGVISFTNELMTTQKYFQRDIDRPSDEQTWLWRDRIAFGDVFTDYTEYDHPKYGKVLIGGPNKWSSRSTPTFMLEEECHRNFAFTMLHADAMPILELDRVEVSRLGPQTWSVTFELRNTKLIPTRTARSRVKRIGEPDLLTVMGRSIAPVASGQLDDWFDEDMDPVRHEPGRVLLDEGVWGRSGRIFRFILTGPEGATATFRYEAEKARDLQFDVELREAPE
ncbi:MAG: hypothetical protein KDA21_12190, partial [Phycisphaerales bacterium]|nr:hypothetical protein [Phycisphaerales bacterium]